MASNILWVSRVILPFSFFHRLRRLYRSKLGGDPVRQEQYTVRQDTVRFTPQPEIHLDVYWKVLPIGKGPAVALFVFDEEVLRFDCFGEGKGHFHVRLTHFRQTKEQRIFFFEKTVEEQIDRTVFELTQNLSYYLQRHPVRLIRETTVDQNQMQLMAEQARQQMLRFLHTVPALSGL